MTTFGSCPLTVEHHPEEGGYLAYFPTLPGCQTWGDTFEEAVQSAEEALAVYVETLMANGDPMPKAAEEAVSEMQISDPICRFTS